MPRTNTIEDIWSYIDIKQDINVCWLWKKSTADKRGYGQTHFNGKHYRSHRLIFELTNGYLPHSVMHTCDNPTCCNPSHLKAGDYLSNNRDRATKGRSNPKRGEDYKLSKLKNSDIIYIRQSYKDKKHTMLELASIFKIHRNYVSDIIHKKAWSHI